MMLVAIMFPVVGNAVSDIDGAGSSVKSKMAAMMAVEFGQLQLKNNAKIIKNAILRLV